MSEKIVMAVLAGGRKLIHGNHPYLINDELHYEKMEQAARDTCFKDPPDNISIYYVYNRDGRAGVDIDVKDGESKLIDDRFYYGIDDPNGKEFIRRCIEFFGYCLKNFDFDYIFRPNLGCWIDMNGLNKAIESLSKQNIWAGDLMYCCRSVPFVSGAGILFSRDVIQLLWDAHITSEYGDTNNSLYTKSKKIINAPPPHIIYDNDYRPEDAAFGCFFGAFQCHPYHQLEINVPLTHIQSSYIHERDISFENVCLDNYLHYFWHPKSPDCYYKMQDVMRRFNKIRDWQI